MTEHSAAENYQPAGIGQTDAHTALVTAIELTLAECDLTGWNLPEALSRALSAVAAEQGSYRLIEHRPGSWEATHVEALDVSEMFR